MDDATPSNPRSPLRLACFIALLVTLAVTACSGAKTTTLERTEPEVLRNPATQNAKIESDLEQLRGHVDTYVERYGELPARLPVLRDTPDGEPIVEVLPRDPWSVPYLIRRFDDEVAISTSGADLIIDSDDDVVLRIGYPPTKRADAAEPQTP